MFESFEPDGPKYVLLKTALEAAVPLRIMEIEARGGVTDYDISECHNISQELGERGDILLFKSKNKGETAAIFNRLAQGLAVMAFCKGGVTFLGRKFIAGEINANETKAQFAPMPNVGKSSAQNEAAGEAVCPSATT